jgi:hypothetical protein
MSRTVVSIVTLLFFIFLCLLVPVSWGVNLWKLTECDFKGGESATYRCEVLHGVGLIPVVSIFTVWADTDTN